jgi:hypothetical protein
LSVSQNFCKEILAFTLTGKYLRGIVGRNIFEPFKLFPMVIMHSWIKAIDEYFLKQAQHIVNYVADRWGIMNFKIAQFCMAILFSLIMALSAVILAVVPQLFMKSLWLILLFGLVADSQCRLFARLNTASEKGELNEKYSQGLLKSRQYYMAIFLAVVTAILLMVLDDPIIILNPITWVVFLFILITIGVMTGALYFASCDTKFQLVE